MLEKKPHENAILPKSAGNGKEKSATLPNNEEKYACWQLQLISVEHQDYEWYKMH